MIMVALKYSIHQYFSQLTFHSLDCNLNDLVNLIMLEDS